MAAGIAPRRRSHRGRRSVGRLIFKPERLTHSLYHNHSGPRGKCFAEAFDSAVERVVRRAQVDQQNLVFRVVNDGG